MKRPQVQLAERLNNLIAFHGLAARRTEILAIFRLLTNDSLADFPASIHPRRSTLTSDGLPIEFSISASARGSKGLRYGVEAGKLTQPLARRLAQSNRLTKQMLHLVGAECGIPLHDQLMNTLIFTQPRVLERARFALWQGLIHRPEQPDTCKVYYNLFPRQPGHSQRLVAATQLLDSYLPASAQWSQVAPWVAACAEAAMIGIDYNGAGIGKAKLYYRCTVPWPIEQVQHLLATFTQPVLCTAFAHFHRAVTNNALVYPERTLMISVGVTNGHQPLALNLHVNLHRYLCHTPHVQARLATILESLQLDPQLYHQTIAQLVGAEQQATLANHSLFTFGVDNGEIKYNLYLKPTWQDLQQPQHPIRRQSSLVAA